MGVRGGGVNRQWCADLRLTFARLEVTPRHNLELSNLKQQGSDVPQEWEGLTTTGEALLIKCAN